MAQKKSRNSGGGFKSSLENALGLKNYDGQLFLLYPNKKNIASLIKEYDPISRRIYLLVIVLSIFGAVIQYSASCYMCANSSDYGYNPISIVKKQVLFMTVGLVLAWVVEHVNYQVFLSRLTPFIYFLSLCSLLLLKTSLGVTVNGATRWIRLPGFQFAPSELVKVAVVLMLADVIQKYSSCLSQYRMTFLLWGIGGVPSLMLWKFGNNLSSFMVVMCITFGITLLTTRTWKLHLIAVAGVCLVLFFWVYRIASNMPTTEELLKMPFRDQRIVAWLAPEDYYSTKGWQVANTMYAAGSGGWVGNGLGSFQRLKNYVPYAYTDVTFAVILYELGLAGAAVFLFLYIFLSYEMIKVAVNAENLFGSVLCCGYMLHICIQVLFHIAVVLNLMPNTGQTLPWVSYSGTTFLCLGIEIGFVLSVARQHYSSYAISELAGKRSAN